MSDLSSDEQKRTVEIPERTAERISDRLTRTEFDSIDAYVTFALEQLLGELDRTAMPEDRQVVSETESTDDGASGEAVQERLESLGYL